jgi:hypothetical protein
MQLLPLIRQVCFATLLAGAVLLNAPRAVAQTTIGHVPITDGGTTSTFFTITGHNQIFVPFKFSSIGSYNVSSVNLFLQNFNAENIGVTLVNALPSGTTIASDMATFTNPGSGGSVGGPANTAFTATSSPTLTAGTEYYIRVYSKGAPLSGTTPTTVGTWLYDYNGSYTTVALSALTSALGTTDAISFRNTLYSTAFTGSLSQPASYSTVGDYDRLGQFSITANALTAVPEPATYATLVGLTVLGVALGMRTRKRRQLAQSSAPRA